MNNNIIVVYKSKYGSTEKYAEYISKELNCECINCSQMKNHDLQNYTTVIYGGGLYASGIYGIKNLKEYSFKNIVIFTVGLGDPKNTDYTEIINMNKKYINAENTNFFHLRGGMDYSKLSFMDRTLMSMLKKFTIDRKKESELTNEDKEMLETYGKKVDFVTRESIAPIINYIEELKSKI